MAIARLRCNLCEQPLAAHCPDSNYTCAWLRCTSPNCSADIYDVHRGLLRHRDAHVERWADQPADDQPPTVTIVGEEGPELLNLEDDADGGTATPDP